MKHILDFSINSNCRNIVITDTSDYVFNSLMPIELPKLFVLTPGQTKYIEVDFKINNINVLNVFNLKIIPKDLHTADSYSLPDGLYMIRYAICPYDKIYKEVPYFHTCELECKLNKERIKNIVCCDTVDLSKLEQLLEGIKSSTEVGNVEGAKMLYNCLAEKLNKC